MLYLTFISAYAIVGSVMPDKFQRLEPVKPYILDVSDQVAPMVDGMPPVLAHIGLGSTAVSDLLTIYDTRGMEGGASTPFLVVDQAFPQGDGRFTLPPTPVHYKGIHPGGEPLILGQAETQGRFNFSGAVSPRHLAVSMLSGRIVLQDLNSRNGTFLLQPPFASTDTDGPLNKGTDYVDEYTSLVNEALARQHNLADDGTYLGHKIIDRHSYSVRNGIYAWADSRDLADGSTSKDFILIDDKTPAIKNLTKSFLDQVWVSSTERNAVATLEKLESFVAETLRYDEAKTDQLSDYASGNIVPLSKFVREGVGVCRHQALLVATIIEDLQEAQTKGLTDLLPEDFAKGHVHVERNQRSTIGGHMWAVYTTPEGRDIIIDPAQHVVGYRDDLLKDKKNWYYKVNLD